LKKKAQFHWGAVGLKEKVVGKPGLGQKIQGTRKSQKKKEEEKKIDLLPAGFSKRKKLLSKRSQLYGPK